MTDTTRHENIGGNIPRLMQSMYRPSSRSCNDVGYSELATVSMEVTSYSLLLLYAN